MTQVALNGFSRGDASIVSPKARTRAKNKKKQDDVPVDTFLMSSRESDIETFFSVVDPQVSGDENEGV